MRMKNIFSTLFFLIITFTFGQKSTYPYTTIPAALLENANSVIRYQLIEVTISSKKQMTIKKKKIVTVLNKYGQNNVDATEYYDKSNKVLSIEALILDVNGREIKRIKRKDFVDQSVADGFSIYSDDRVLNINYTPTNYPYTVVYESECQTSNTAFINSWNPIDDYFESVEQSEYKISYPSNLKLNYKEINLSNIGVKKEINDNIINYSVSSLNAEKKEDYSPILINIFPHVLFTLEDFNLEGVEGSAKSWEDFGKWIYNNLLLGTEELTEETKIKIKELVKNENDPLKKAKIIYKYVQDKTRYVSIQLGIGGWKPMLAKDVDRLGYGDCKALSNYTRVLLKVVGIESYYTIIYGDDSIRNIDKDFVAMQGNHAVLALPINEKLYFLECTSQSTPFGFESDFTDDRYALIVKPDKGEIIKTNNYNEKLSAQYTTGNYSLDELGNITAEIKIKSTGIQYSNRHSLEKKSKDEIDTFYKSNFYWLNNIKILQTKFKNDKENIEFSELIQIHCDNYASKSNNSLIIPFNVFNQSLNIPQRYRNRKNPVEILRGFYDEDEVEINLPNGFKLENKSDNIVLNEKFGTYKMELIVVNPNKLIYKRSFLLKKGLYDKSEYDNYRKFREQVAKLDNSKIIINKS